MNVHFVITDYITTLLYVSISGVKISFARVEEYYILRFILYAQKLKIIQIIENNIKIL